MGLEGMEHTLAEKGKSRPAVAHPFDQFQLVHFALNHAI
jgi:hypothetical protein